MKHIWCYMSNLDIVFLWEAMVLLIDGWNLGVTDAALLSVPYEKQKDTVFLSTCSRRQND